MKLTPTIKRGLLAVALAVTATAHATNVPQYNTGDLLLGFYETGFAKDYVVDLGNVSTDIASSFTLLNTNTHLAADLAAVFGPNWYTNGLLYWGMAASNTVSKEIWASNPNATPWTGDSAQGVGAQDVATMGGAYGNAPQNNGELYSKGLVQTASDSGSWVSLASPNAGNNNLSLDTFGGSSGDLGINDLVTNSIRFEDVKAVNNKPGADTGSFAINSTGDLSFTSTAVPEPSTFAAIAGGAALLTLARRHRALI